MSGPRNTQFNPLPRWLLLLFLLQIKEEEKKEQKLSNSLHLVASFFFKIKSFFIEGLVKWTEEENYNGGNVIGWISAWSIKTWRQTRGYEWWSLCVLVNGFARSAIGFSHTNHTWWIENEFKGVWVREERHERNSPAALRRQRISSPSQVAPVARFQ